MKNLKAKFFLLHLLASLKSNYENYNDVRFYYRRSDHVKNLFLYHTKGNKLWILKKAYC